MTHKASSVDEGRKRMAESLNNGTALNKFKHMLIEQRVEERIADELCYGNPVAVLPMANHRIEIKSPKEGINQSFKHRGIRVIIGIGCTQGRGQQNIFGWLLEFKYIFSRR